jgi:hypothetical protein
MIEPPGQNDRLLGVVCLIACPAISGVFLGVIAALCAYPADSDHAITIGAVVGACAFAANAIAICLTAVAAEGRAQRRAARALTFEEIASVLPETEAPARTRAQIARHLVVPRAYEELGRRS